MQIYEVFLFKYIKIMFKLKEFRQSHSLFQAKMAEILGLTQSGISRMESDKIELTKAQYEKLYSIYGKEDVDAFRIEVGPTVVDAQYKEPKHSTTSAEELLEIIKKQNEIICNHMKAQDEYNKRLLDLLEKMTLK